MIRRVAVVAAMLVAALAALAEPAPAADTGPMSTWQVARLPLASRDVAFDATRQQLLVAVSPTVPGLGNHLLEIDPETGALGRDLPLMASPRTVAVSDDGTRAYVGFDGAGVVVEVDLATFTEVRRFAVGRPGISASAAAEIVIQPGRADVIAVALRHECCNIHSTAVFEDGVARPNRVTSVFPPFSLAFGDDPTQLFGVSTPFEYLTEMAVDEDGVTLVALRNQWLSSSGIDVEGSVLTSANGRAIDLDTNTLIGSYGRGGPMAMDHANGHAYILASGLLTRHRTSDRVQIDSRALTGSFRQLLDVGTGLAAVSSSEIALLGPGVTGDAFVLPSDPPTMVRSGAEITTTIYGAAMVPSPDGRRLYVSTTGDDAPGAGVVEIDPDTGGRLRMLPLPGDPKALAISDDGGTLFVGFAANNIVAEVDLDDFTIRREVPLPDNPESFSLGSSIIPVPGRDDSYLVDLADTDPSPTANEQGTVLVDGGVVLADRIAPGLQRPTFFLDDPGVAYGIGSRQLTRFTLDGNGVRSSSQVAEVTAGSGAHPVVAGGRAYVADGSAVDPVAGVALGRVGAADRTVPVPGSDRLLQVLDGSILEHRLSDQSTVATHTAVLEGTDPPRGAAMVDGALAVLGPSSGTLTLVRLLARPRPPRTVHPDPDPEAVVISWRRPVDDGGAAVTSYRVYRDGSLVHETADGTTRRFVDSGRTPGVDHTYEVSAVNDHGESARSPAVTGAAGGTEDIDPTIELLVPQDGGTYARGSEVLTDFSCADDGGSGLASCEGDLSDGQAIDTSRLGNQEFTVRALDGEGNLTETTATFAVVDGTRPTATITTPRVGLVAIRGQQLTVRYSCGDEVGGSGLMSCDGPVVSGGRLNTNRAGFHQVEVVATDNAGNERVVRRSYRVRHALCDGRPVTVLAVLREHPTNGNDVIQADDEQSLINGLGGNDLICSGGRDDKLIGGPGDDRILGGHGDDWLLGGPGRDTLEGQKGSDLSEGGPGNDRIIGGPDVDYCDGQTGVDTMTQCEYYRNVP